MRYRVLQPRDVQCPLMNHTKDVRVCLKGPYPECSMCKVRRKERATFGERWFQVVELDQRPTWAKQWVEIGDDGSETVITNEAYQEAPSRMKRNSFWDGFKPSSPTSYSYKPRQATEKQASTSVPTPAPVKKRKPTLGDVGLEATLNRSVHRSRKHGAESKRKRKPGKR